MYSVSSFNFSSAVQRLSISCSSQSQLQHRKRDVCTSDEPHHPPTHIHHFDFNTSNHSPLCLRCRPVVRNGLSSPSRPAQASMPGSRRLPAHALDFRPHILALGPSAPTSLRPLSDPQVDAHCRFPRYTASADSASTAAED